MTPTETKCLDAFPVWLRTLGDDAELLGRSLSEQKHLTANARNLIAGSLNYLFKVLDLIPDGVDDIGYLDDAFVLRVAASLAIKDGGVRPEMGDSEKKGLERLAADADLVREFLSQDFGRLEGYVNGLRRAAARGRTVDDILDDDAVLDAFTSEVRAFARGYSPPTFTRETRTLVKLRAFFDAKLPQ